jgi:hypothetical protein
MEVKHRYIRFVRTLLGETLRGKLREETRKRLKIINSFRYINRCQLNLSGPKFILIIFTNSVPISQKAYCKEQFIVAV